MQPRHQCRKCCSCWWAWTRSATPHSMPNRDVSAERQNTFQHPLPGCHSVLRTLPHTFSTCLGNTRMSNTLQASPLKNQNHQSTDVPLITDALNTEIRCCQAHHTATDLHRKQSSLCQSRAASLPVSDKSSQPPEADDLDRKPGPVTQQKV